jgi:hypothetical protein
VLWQNSRVKKLLNKYRQNQRNDVNERKTGSITYVCYFDDRYYILAFIIVKKTAEGISNKIIKKNKP